MFKKIIIYGHKLHSHTHSYIHKSFYDAFKMKGFNVVWIDKNDKFDHEDFSNCLFLTEGMVMDKMPIRDDCKYLLHFVEEDRIRELGLKEKNILRFRFFEINSLKFEKIDDFVYYDNGKRELWMAWASNLFPEQINKIPETMFNPNEINVNFIGSIWDVNQEYIENFINSCQLNGKLFNWKRNLNNKEYYYHTIKSFVTVDFRGKVHLNIGYLPCRIFKSLSVGVMPGTNSKYVKDFFGDYVYYNENTNDLLLGTADFWATKTKKDIRGAMNFISNKHTYLNRIDNILEVLNGL